jgi:hypothetical protein
MLRCTFDVGIGPITPARTVATARGLLVKHEIDSLQPKLPHRLTAALGLLSINIAEGRAAWWRYLEHVAAAAITTPRSPIAIGTRPEAIAGGLGVV